MIRIFMLLFALFLPLQTLFAQLPNVDFDAKMREYNLVDIQTLAGAEQIIVYLQYSEKYNFVGEDMYGSLEKAYFTRDFAEKVLRAQSILQSIRPDLTLLIYDAARPISVQRYMRSLVEGTDKEDFVASGTKGGRHNFGVAVDVTLAHLDGTPLDMGAGFDEFSDKAAVKGTSDTNDAANRNMRVYSAFVNDLVKRGLISSVAAENRLLLIKVMNEAGLVPYRREWWHFEQIMPMSEVRTKYRLLDF